MDTLTSQLVTATEQVAQAEHQCQRLRREVSQLQGQLEEALADAVPEGVDVDRLLGERDGLRDAVSQLREYVAASALCLARLWWCDCVAHVCVCVRVCTSDQSDAQREGAVGGAAAQRDPGQGCGRVPAPHRQTPRRGR